MSKVTAVTRSAWATPVLIVCLVVGAYGVGWWSGKNGSFVRNLIEVAQTANWLKHKLDITNRVLDKERKSAIELAREKLSLEERLRKMLGKPKPKPKPKYRAPRSAPKPPKRDRIYGSQDGLDGRSRRDFWHRY